MVSIIASLYKSEKYLSEFIKHLEVFISWAKKNNFPFECIVIANNPSAKELAAFEKFKNQPWFSFVSIGREPLYATWNRGVDLAKGNVLGFWNVDDIRFPKAVMEAYELSKHGADVIYFPFIIKRYLNIGPISFPIITRKVEGEVLKFEKRKFETSMTAGPFFMFTRQAYKTVGPFDEQFKIAGDFDWCARAAQAGLNFSLGKQFSGIFRVDGRGLSAGANKRRSAENNIIYLRHNALELILPHLEPEMAAYRPQEILYQGKWQPYKNSP